MAPNRSLAIRLALPLLAFVVAGSIALVIWIGAEERQESRRKLFDMAATNARFIREAHLPLTERTADELSRVLGVGVYFLNRNGGWTPRIPANSDTPAPYYMLIREGWFVTADGKEGALAAISGEERLVLIRQSASALAFLFRFRTLAVLGAFWALSLSLAWALARGIVRPLRALADRLPRIADENAEPLPEAARSDEIGQLARAYLATRAALAAERRAREQAERLATLGRMATGLAHEINNPVAAIKLHAQLIEMGTTTARPPSSSPGTGLDSLSIILAENAKIEALVNQWMFLARPHPPALAPCDLADLVANALHVCAPAAGHARVSIVNDTRPGLTLSADARRLGQAIGNVIINAIQAMSARGGTLTVSSSSGAGQREIVFTDTGPGFSAAALARHAELFFSEKEGGMGIGLNVTAEILHAHGGELRVANAPAGGAIVTFVLPRAENLKS